MNIVFILPSLEKIAPVTVIVNIISFLLKVENIKVNVMTLQDTPLNNYKEELESRGVIIYEYSGIKKAFEDKGEYFWNGIDIIHINSLKPNILAYFLQKKYKHLKSLVTIHSVEKIDYVQSRGFIKGNLFYRINAFLCKKRDKVVAVSLDVLSYLKAMHIHNSICITNGIDISKFQSYDIKKDTNSVHLVQVGVINVNKNQIYSLNLLKYLLDAGLSVTLHLVGGVKDKAYKASLERYIEVHHLDKQVVFYGNLPFPKLTEVLSRKDILLMPSYSEGLPLSPLEGYFYNLPAITSDKGGLKEVNLEDETGIFVNIQDDSSFEKVKTFIDSGRYKEMATNLNSYVVQNFNTEIMSQKYYELYLSLLD